MSTEIVGRMQVLKFQWQTHAYQTTIIKNSFEEQTYAN
jgi:hypothetical protein